LTLSPFFMCSLTEKLVKSSLVPCEMDLICIIRTESFVRQSLNFDQNSNKDSKFLVSSFKAKTLTRNSSGLSCNAFYLNFEKPILVCYRLLEKAAIVNKISSSNYFHFLCYLNLLGKLFFLLIIEFANLCMVISRTRRLR